jgi:hypothetical protein
MFLYQPLTQFEVNLYNNNVFIIPSIDVIMDDWDLYLYSVSFTSLQHVMLILLSFLKYYYYFYFHDFVILDLCSQYTLPMYFHTLNFLFEKQVTFLYFIFCVFFYGLQFLLFKLVGLISIFMFNPDFLGKYLLFRNLQGIDYGSLPVICSDSVLEFILTKDYINVYNSQIIKQEYVTYMANRPSDVDIIEWRLGWKPTASLVIFSYPIFDEVDISVLVDTGFSSYYDYLNFTISVKDHFWLDISLNKFHTTILFIITIFVAFFFFLF